MGSEETADPSAVRVSRPKPRSRGHVTIFGTWCKGCGICIEFCPQGVFKVNGQGRTAIARPERCTACHWCDSHCPDMAIVVRRLEDDEVEDLAGEHPAAEETAPPIGGEA